MPRDDFYTPTDTDALRMENELLAFEVRFLKTQLAERERADAPLKSRLQEAESRLQEAESRLQEAESRLQEAESRLQEADSSAEQLRDRLAEAERAKQDLVLLLRRLAHSPLGRFFRLRQSFLVLERRYLDNDA